MIKVKRIKIVFEDEAGKEILTHRLEFPTREDGQETRTLTAGDRIDVSGQYVCVGGYLSTIGFNVTVGKGGYA